MASEPFDVTDDNGIRVTGTVDVFRHPKGPYFDPKSKYYKQPRYADAHFDYFNTREACTIDRNALSKAMEDAFAKALTRFGIKDPGRGRIAEDVNASIDATRQQCILNADKYVSNETSSSTNWETGKAVGNLTAKAYAAVPAPGGGTQTVVARENSWPADDVSTLKNYAGTNARILSRRVIARDADSNIGNWNSSLTGIDPINPMRGAPSPQTDAALESPAASRCDTWAGEMATNRKHPYLTRERRQHRSLRPMSFFLRMAEIPSATASEAGLPLRQALRRAS